MGSLVLHPTATAQWHTLVQEAQQACQETLPLELENYLVFLLMRFMTDPETLSRVLAMDYLESTYQMPRERFDNLQSIGDRCLLISGLFPERARRRRVAISYYVKLGQSAYRLLSASLYQTNTHLFENLSTAFVSLMDVLQTARELTEPHSSLDLLQATELWQETGSLHALAVLKKTAQNFPIIYFPTAMRKH